MSDELTHYGVKGMKWGHRKPRTKEVTVRKKGKKYKAEGGYGHDIHDDAKYTLMARQVAKRSGVSSLSNKELQSAVNRMNLEQQYARLAAADRSAGQKIVSELMGKEGKRLIQDLTKEAIANAKEFQNNK